MRSLFLFALLASTAVPAFAADEGPRGFRSNHSEQSERADRKGGGERQRASETMREERRAIRVERARTQEAAPVSNSRESRGMWRGREQGQQSQRSPVETNTAGGGGLMPRQRPVRTIPDTTPTTQATTQHWRGDRDRDRDRAHNGTHRRWTRDWRSDRRYDWRRYRDHNRSTFRIGIYYDPFGWNYRRWSIGSYLYPNYYSSNYWIDDPWMYRLPPAYGSYRWVRYHNDALLIDTWNGMVVDVIYNFFW